MYDLEIIKELNNIFENNIFDEIVNNLNDFEILKLATEFLKNAKDRLKYENNKKYKKEYNELNIICNKLDDIIKNYK